MKPRKPNASGERGQATIELSVICIVLALIVFAAVEIGLDCSLSLRLASTAREGGRLIIANNITPDPADSVSANNTNLTSQLNSTVYTDIDNMTQPADIPNKGRVIISYLIHTDPLGNSDDSDASTETDDYIQVDYQFLFPTSSTVSVSSKIPTSSYTDVNGTDVKKVDTSYLPLKALQDGERTVIVEIFHQTGMLPGVANLMKMSGFQYLYEYALY